MKKTILFSFLTILVISYNEESAALTSGLTPVSAFGLNSTTMQANNRFKRFMLRNAEYLSEVEGHNPKQTLIEEIDRSMSISRDLSFSSSTSSDGHAREDESEEWKNFKQYIFDERGNWTRAYDDFRSSSSSSSSYRINGFDFLATAARETFSNRYLLVYYNQLYQSSFANLQISSSNPMAHLFNPKRLNKKLLTSEEWFKSFADMDMDREKCEAIENIARCLGKLHSLLTKYNNFLNGDNSGKDAYEDPDPLLSELKAELEKIDVDIKQYISLMPFLYVDLEKIPEKDKSKMLIKKMKEIYLLCQSILQDKIWNLPGASEIDISKEENDFIKELLGDINRLRESMPILVFEFDNNYISGGQVKDIDPGKIASERTNASAYKDAAVSMLKIPEYEYVLNYRDSSILNQLQDRTSRDQFRIQIGFSWKDMLDLFTYDLSIANLNEDAEVQRLLSSVLIDTYNNPAIWVAADDEEAICANEDARRLAFAMFNGGVHEQILFTDPNNAMISLQNSMNQILSVTQGTSANDASDSLFSIENSLGNGLLDLFELGRANAYWNSSKLLFKRSGHEKSFQDPKSSSGVLGKISLRVKNYDVVDDFKGQLDFFNRSQAGNYKLDSVAKDQINGLQGDFRHNLLILHEKKTGAPRWYTLEYLRRIPYGPTLIVHENEGQYTLISRKRPQAAAVDEHASAESGGAVTRSLNFSNLPLYSEQLERRDVDTRAFTQSKGEGKGDFEENDKDSLEMTAVTPTE